MESQHFAVCCCCEPIHVCLDSCLCPVWLCSSSSRQSYRSRRRSDPILPGAVAGLELVGGSRALDLDMELELQQLQLPLELKARVLEGQTAAWAVSSFWPPCMDPAAPVSSTTTITSSINSRFSLPRWKNNSRSTGTGTMHSRARHGRAQHVNEAGRPQLQGYSSPLPLLYAGSSHFSWPHLANPSDLPQFRPSQALVGDRQAARQQDRQTTDGTGGRHASH